jgi:hypothetical protein
VGVGPGEDLLRRQLGSGQQTAPFPLVACPASTPAQAEAGAPAPASALLCRALGPLRHLLVGLLTDPRRLPMSARPRPRPQAERLLPAGGSRRGDVLARPPLAGRAGAAAAGTGCPRRAGRGAPAAAPPRRPSRSARNVRRRLRPVMMVLGRIACEEPWRPAPAVAGRPPEGPRP